MAHNLFLNDCSRQDKNITLDWEVEHPHSSLAEFGPI